VELGVIINLKKIVDSRGNLSFIEFGDHGSFDIKRAYWMWSPPEGTVRGYHAHKNLKQYFLCLHGSYEIVLDNSIKKEKYILNDPSCVLQLQTSLWRECRALEPDSVLMSLASEVFDENDYIRNYEDFVKYASSI